MESKKWPIDNYFKTLKKLKEDNEFTPIIIGGVEDAGPAQLLLNKLGFGYSLAGKYSVRDTAGFFKEMRFLSW